MSDQLWINRPFSVMGHLFDVHLLPKDPREQVAFKRGLGFDSEHWLSSLFKTGGDDGKQWLLKTRYGCVEDLLRPYLKAAKAEGLKVIVYVNAHWYTSDFPAEMLLRRADGSAVTGYGAGLLTCPGGPFLKYMLDLAEDLSEYAIDGVFLDGPIASPCWCESCRKQYRERFDAHMPDQPRNLRELRNAHHMAADNVAEFVGAFRDTLRRKQPQAIVYHNGTTLGSLTWSNQTTIRRADLLGIEGGFIGYNPLNKQFLYKTAATGKLLEALADGKPAVMFDDHAFKVYDYTPHTPAELDLMLLGTLTTNANPWFLIYYSNRDTHAPAVAKRWNQLIAEHREDRADTHSAEEAALLWSDSMLLAAQNKGLSEDSVHADASTTANQFDVDYHAAFDGAYEMLARSALPFRLAVEDKLAENLKGVKVLVAPSCLVLSQSAFENVKDFVHRGGVLLADDRFGAFDEFGQARDAKALRELLGLEYGADIPFAQRGIDYIASDESDVLAGIAKSPIPRPTRAVQVRLQGAKALVYLYKPLTGRYDYLTDVSDAPAVTEHAFGKGFVTLLPMNLFEHYGQWLFGEHRQFVDNLLRRHWRPSVEVEGLHQRGEVMVRAKDGALLVNLINYNGFRRPFEYIQPLNDVRIVVRGHEVKTAHGLVGGQSLKIDHRGGDSVVHLPELRAGEMVMMRV